MPLQCPHCNSPLFWDVHRAFHSEIPKVILLTKCIRCDGPKSEWRMQSLEVIWPVVPFEPLTSHPDAS